MIKTRHLSTLLAAALAAPVAGLAAGVAGLDLSLRDSDMEPSVTLREHENRQVEEYRVNSQLYMVKITPTVGAPYYLVDEDGSGEMAWHRGGSGVEQKVPQWTLMSW
jgi:hypothetical protein